MILIQYKIRAAKGASVLKEMGCKESGESGLQQEEQEKGRCRTSQCPRVLVACRAPEYNGFLPLCLSR